MLLRALALLAPPLCAACDAPCEAAHPLCARCAGALARAPAAALAVPGADWALAATAYEGTPRAIVTALKFHGRVALAAPMAAAIVAAAGGRSTGMTIVPVPPAPRRLRRRGFDPAHEVAAASARLAAVPFACCLRRADGPRQVGRERRERLASPPSVRAVGQAPERALLVDDVVTTGATLGACAVALRSAGASEVGALAFSRAK